MRKAQVVMRRIAETIFSNMSVKGPPLQLTELQVLILIIIKSPVLVAGGNLACDCPVLITFSHQSIAVFVSASASQHS